jgi:hypothetical protein
MQRGQYSHTCSQLLLGLDFRPFAIGVDAELTRPVMESTIPCMARICVYLAVLLLVLTFNAYACVLPLQPESMDCSSATEQPVRQTCDAFLELGPQSHASSSQELPTLKVLEFEAAPQLPTPVSLVFRPEHPPRGADTSIHLSIPTTVLRI